MTETLVISCLTPSDVVKYKQELTKNDAWLGFVRESFEITSTVTKGIKDSDMPLIIERANDPVFKQVLREVVLIGEGEVKIWQGDVFENGMYRKCLVFYVRRSDGLYNLVRVFATQKVEIKVAKLVVLGLASAASGAVAGGLIAGPIGAAVGGVIGAAGVGGKATYDYKTASNVVSGYILSELEDRKILRINNKYIVETII